MANGDNLPYQDLDVVPFTPITSEWGDGIGDDILALAAGTGLDDGAVTSNKLGTGANQDYVPTEQGTISDSYADLPTVGPSTTVTIGNNGLALVSLYSRMTSNSTGTNFYAFQATGANSINPTDSLSIFRSDFGAGSAVRYGASFLLTGLNPGSTTFTAKYKRLGAGTSSYSDRRIAVVPL